MPERKETASGPGTVSRRVFLGTSATVGGLFLVSCTTADTAETARPFHTPPDQTPSAGLQFLTEEEARTVQAVIGRLIPGDEQDPGAVEAGGVAYIDAKLASFTAFAEPTYISGPYVQVISGGSGGEGGQLTVAEDQLYRYGFQSGVHPQDVYRNGLPGLDRYSRQRFDSVFADLDDADQDAVLDVLDQIQQSSEAAGNTDPPPSGTEEERQAAEEAFGPVDPGYFFSTLRTDAIEGMFADPLYGGNQNLAGWHMIGYPGPQRAYSAEEMLAGTTKQPQALDDMAHMNPDRHDSHGRDALEQPHPNVKDG